MYRRLTLSQIDEVFRSLAPTVYAVRWDKGIMKLRVLTEARAGIQAHRAARIFGRRLPY